MGGRLGSGDPNETPSNDGSYGALIAAVYQLHLAVERLAAAQKSVVLTALTWYCCVCMIAITFMAIALQPSAWLIQVVERLLP